MVVVEQTALLDAKKENLALAGRIATLEGQSDHELAGRPAESDEVSQLRRENQELQRLRGEVARLQAQKKELERLRAENQQLRDLVASEKDRIQQQWAAWVSALRTSGMKPDDVLPLIQALTNDAPSVRLEATKVLRQIGIERLLNTNLTAQAELDLRAAARTAVPGLATALNDSDPMVRANAAISLGFLHEQSEIAVPALARALNDEENRVALSAAKALGRLQSDAAGAIPALLEAAQSPDAERRAAAIAALGLINP